MTDEADVFIMSQLQDEINNLIYMRYQIDKSIDTKKEALLKYNLKLNKFADDYLKDAESGY